MSSLLVRCLAVGLVSAGLSTAPITAHADSTTFSGDAYVAKATLTSPLGSYTVEPLAESGPLPAEGGRLENSILTLNVPNPLAGGTLLTGEVGHTAAIGQGDRSRSEASVASVNLTVAGQAISADFLMARAMAKCGPSVTGSSELASLVINGTAISVGTQPNQTVDLPLGAGKVVINEQSSNVSGDSGSMDVNALHVIVTGVADVVVAHAHADISCPGPSACSGGDFLTGGGWITGKSGARANFAVAGGIKDGAYWGHLLYIDHGDGTKVKGTGVNMYIAGATATTRHTEGTDDVSPGRYAVDAADNEEPGHDLDSFAIDLFNGYQAGGPLQGGNIQLHKPCQ